MIRTLTRILTAMSDLGDILETIREEMNDLNTARDAAISQSRELIRHCAKSIRAIHRRDWDDVQEKLAIVQSRADDLRAVVAEYPELYHSGYTQDALKEVVEAHITYAIIRDDNLPSAADLKVVGSTYLKGLGEAATELRRFILDIMRHSERHSEEAERLLDWMDEIYGHLITFDFPDALTHGLRRQTDIVRGVLERTRGDMTSSLRQQQLQDAIAQFEKRLADVEDDS
ncbi:MAG: haloacid dehalogenase [Chloroflexota bacterium]